MGLTSFQGSLYVAVYKVSGESGKLFKSEDGKKFTEIDTIKEGVMSLIVYKEVLYVGTITKKDDDTIGKLYSSADGQFLAKKKKQ